jgi:DNA modification methylase
VHSQDEYILMISPRNASGFIAEDGAWKKVRSISESGPAEVWDLQVADDESFTVEGCVVHNCPLQLDLSERAIQLWSNPGDVICSPFAGIGSEGVSALKHHRRFLGTEIKDKYFDIGSRNLRNSTKQLSMFSHNLTAKATNQSTMFGDL